MTLADFVLSSTLKPSSRSGYKKLEITGVSFNGSHGIQNFVSHSAETSVSNYYPRHSFSYGEQSFVKGSGDSTGTISYIDSVRFSLRVTKNDNTTVSGTADVDLRVQARNQRSYNWLNIGFNTASVTLSQSMKNYFNNLVIAGSLTAPAFTAVSSQSVLGTPTYVDCDLGECYKLVDGSIASLNAYIDLGSELPTLGTGETEITFDNTITDLKVVPRWWKI
jgi:hypothetical protein